MNQITLHQSALVFIDYDAIYGAFKRYRLDPFQLNFFPGILDHLKNTHELDVIETTVYADFDCLPAHHQTYLRQMGLSTRHCKNTSDSSLYLAVDAVVRLYDSPVIDVFVIITGLKELIPVLSTIRYNNKFAYCITLKENFDPTLSTCSDLHEFLDDIFGFKVPDKWKVEINRKDLTYDDIKLAQTVARFFYNSYIWRSTGATGKLVTLKGYLSVINRALKEDVFQLKRAFEIAHFLRYVTIYQINDKLYLKQGERYKKVMKQEI